MDTVRAAYLLLFGIMGLPPALGFVIPFTANALLMALLCVYIGSHLSLRAVHTDYVSVSVPVCRPPWGA